MERTTQQVHSDKEQGIAIVDVSASGAEKASTLFEPDILVSEQYHTVYRKHLRSPEHELLIAVLEEALADFQKFCAFRDGKGKKRFATAEAWFLDGDSDWTFSFENVCAVLGFDPQYLRQGLLRWKQARLSKRSIAPMGLTRKRHKARVLNAA